MFFSSGNEKNPLLYPPYFPRTGRDFGTRTKKTSIHVDFSHKQRVQACPGTGQNSPGCAGLAGAPCGASGLRSTIGLLDRSTALPAPYADASRTRATPRDPDATTPAESALCGSNDWGARVGMSGPRERP